MKRSGLNLLLDWVLLIVTFVTILTGLVLLLCFHAGDAAFASSALGLSKLLWLNLHRFSCVVMAICVVLHIGLHWKLFRTRLSRFIMRKTKRWVDSEVIMYTTLFVATFTGFALWLALQGSSPVFGPVLIGRASLVRHPWIDTHYTFSLISLMFVIHHTAHRWRFMVRRAQNARVSQRGNNAVTIKNQVTI